jgi:CNT family concentrative nucleoside transporter
MQPNVMLQIQSLVGIAAILLLAYVWSANRRAIRFRIVLSGLALQALLAIVLLSFPAGIQLFAALGSAVTSLLGFAGVGARFLFGNLADSSFAASFGFQFALTVVPIIVFFSSLVSVLYHLGIMQRVVRSMAWILRRTLGTSPIESLSAAANVLLGQTEAPLLVRHYLPHASMSEIFAIMVGGFATIAGSTMGVYVALGIDASTLMVASLLAAPGGLVMAKMAWPQGDEGVVDVATIMPSIESGNIVDALAHGAKDGMMLAVNVLVVLLAFVSVVAMLDAGLALIGGLAIDAGMPWFPASLRDLMALFFQPFAWLLGVSPADQAHVGALLGTKLSVTEFVAYNDLAMLVQKGAISQRSVTISTIALCGFANVASIGIQIGGFAIMAPQRRADVARAGFKAMCIGALTSMLAAAMAGVVIS